MMSEIANCTGALMCCAAADAAIAVRTLGASSRTAPASVVAMNVVENVKPVSVLKTGEAERLVEAAVAFDAEIGAEDDSDPAADLRDFRCRGVRPGMREKAKTAVLQRAGRPGSEKNREGEEKRELTDHSWLDIDAAGVPLRAL